MGRLTVFEHTADVGMEVDADDLRDLFVTAARGVMAYVVADHAEVRAVDWEEVALAAESVEELFLAWLGELIFRQETRHRVYAVFDVEVDEAAGTLNGRIGGEALDAGRHGLDHEVKAVTRHGAVVERTAERWRARFILDI
jgi:SHS2 domain-containing protein